MKATNARSKHSWRPRVGWGVPVAWLTLCVVWSSTWLVIKIGLRDLPPISYAAIRFVLAVIVLLVVSTGRGRLLPRPAPGLPGFGLCPGLLRAVSYWRPLFGGLHTSPRS